MVLRINPILAENEMNEKINSILSLEEVPYIFRNEELKKQRLQSIKTAETEIEKLPLSYEIQTKMRQRLYADKFVLELKEGSDYLQLFVSGVLGFALGYFTNDGVRNYFNKLAKEFVSETMKASFS